ncbi:MAG: PQQ-dependent sugar dehydrogenase, partial [Longimicrobiales bacterium]|nr:PQQ-dependent sugar dehydrogenase [Longimicrobiales bacterium]
RGRRPRSRWSTEAVVCLAGVLLLGAGCSGDGTPSSPGEGDPPPTTPPPAPPPGGGAPLTLATEVVASGLSNPLFLTAPAGDARLFVVEQPGRIRVVRDGQLLATPFLDLSGRISSGGERGLLGLAFHPEFAQNGRFFVSFTDPAGNSRIEAFTVSGDPDRADAASAREVLTVGQPFSNHNGGQISFGPDGFLYVALGDGGGAGDPLENGQNPETLLGALLRIDVDVDGAEPFTIPPDNPFVGGAGADEIWAWGLRNPWRFAFDAVDGLLYIADVGQNSREEVNVVPAEAAGLNYGWNVTEGSTCFGASGCATEGFTLPAVEYDHSQGCSVTGGFVYRGAAIPEVAGHYFYSDFCSGFLRSFRFSEGAVAEERSWSVGALGQVLSFGTDAEGELYILSADGQVRRVTKGS